MSKKCCFPYCPNSQKKKLDNSNHIQFHSFPLYRPAVLEKWVAPLNRGPWWVPGTSSRLCSDHFSPESFRDCPGSKRRLLNPDAVPTIFERITRRKLHKKRRILTKPKVNPKQVTLPHKHKKTSLTVKDTETDGVANEVEVQINNVLEANDDKHEDANHSDCLNYVISQENGGQSEAEIDPADQSGHQFEILLVEDIKPDWLGDHDGESTKLLDKSEKSDPTGSGTIQLGFHEKKLECQRAKMRALQRKVKILQLRLHRRDNRIRDLRIMLSQAKEKVKKLSKGVDALSGLDGFPHELITHSLRNRDAKKTGVRYSAKMKEFALTLFCYSPKAYVYVRSLLQHLPSPSLIKKWIASYNRTEHPQPVDAIEIINDIGQELIIDNINDFIVIENPIDQCVIDETFENQRSNVDLIENVADEIDIHETGVTDDTIESFMLSN